MIRVGGGVLAGSIRVTWKTRWVLSCAGSFNLTVVGLMTSMGYRPMNLDSYVVQHLKAKSLNDSQTCWEYEGAWRHFILAILLFWMEVHFKASLVWFQTLHKAFIMDCTEGMMGSGCVTVRSVGWYPKEIAKGEHPVAEDILILCVYSFQSKFWLQEVGFWAQT